MDTWKFAKFLLLNENAVEDYRRFLEIQKKLKTSFKNYWRVDYSKLNHEQAYNIRNKMLTVRHSLDEIIRRNGNIFECNTLVLDAEIKRITDAMKWSRWTPKKNTKVMRENTRQKLAKKNRSCGKSKNR